MDPALNYDDELEAAKDAVKYLGGPKKVGELLFPEKQPDAAARYLLDALNPARAERLAKQAPTETTAHGDQPWN